MTGSTLSGSVNVIGVSEEEEYTKGQKNKKYLRNLWLKILKFGEKHFNLEMHELQWTSSRMKTKAYTACLEIPSSSYWKAKIKRNSWKTNQRRKSCYEREKLRQILIKSMEHRKHMLKYKHITVLFSFWFLWKTTKFYYASF